MINYVEKGWGLHEAVQAAGHWLRRENGVWLSSNDTAVQAIIDGYDPLAYLKARKQATLDAQFDAHFDLARFIREGTATTVTGTQVGNFLANVTNRYRTLRAAIAAAVDQAALAAIDISSGWPSNP